MAPREGESDWGLLVFVRTCVSGPGAPLSVIHAPKGKQIKFHLLRFMLQD